MNFVELMNVVKLNDEVTETRADGSKHIYVYKLSRKQKKPILQEKESRKYITDYELTEWTNSEYEITTKMFVLRHSYLTEFAKVDTPLYLNIHTMEDGKLCYYLDGYGVKYTMDEILKLRKELNTSFSDFDIIETK